MRNYIDRYSYAFVKAQGSVGCIHCDTMYTLQKQHAEAQAQLASVEGSSGLLQELPTLEHDWLSKREIARIGTLRTQILQASTTLSVSLSLN